MRELWEGIKGKEKGSDPEPGALRPLPATLPALSQGERWGRMAAEVGFDWPDAAGPLHKVAEELEELRDAGRAGDVAQVEAEVGDLLFAVTSFCRHWGVDPERALKGALARFRERFRRIEGALAELESPSLAELDRLWARAKEADPASPPGTASPEP